MSLKGVAKETLRILEEGKYIAPSGKTVDIFDLQQAAVNETVLYTPVEANALLKQHERCKCTDKNPDFQVTDEKTQAAARRLVQSEGCSDLVLLNYASARNPGGGFINGAKAQEEDLARCSGLYPCLLTQPAYYEANRMQSSLLYTDHIIYSPYVPWFRLRNRELLEDAYAAAVITAPAPNAGQLLRRDPDAGPAIEKTFRNRAGMVLGVARDNGHRNLLLGAWGCGVFGNNPSMVAEIFRDWLSGAEFHGCFDRAVFAVYDPTPKQSRMQAFKTCFQL